MSDTLEKLKFSDKVCRSENSVWRLVGDQVVLLSPEDATFHWFDEVGTKIWLQLENPSSVTQIASVIFEEYDEKIEVIENDTISFLEKLIEMKVVGVNAD